MKEKKERIRVIDGIRGVSLLGILLANLLIFQYGIWGKDDIGFYQIASFDYGAYYFTKIFIEGSFMPIFTFLFGYSMILMKNSLERKNLKVKRHFVRRALFLVIVGLLHGYFLWEGDILLFYGLMSLILLIFINRKKKTIFGWAIAIFILSGLIGFGSYSDSMDPELIPPERLEAYHEQTLHVYGSGSYLEILEHRLNETPIDLGPIFMLGVLLFAPILSIPMFLFGMYAAKRKMFFQLEKEQKLYRFGLLFIPLGLIMKGAYYYFSDVALMGIMFTFGSDLLSLGYIFLVAFLYSKFHSAKLLRVFESVGQLSMSNYLMQTIICTTIFYGYGLGLFAQLGVLNGIFLGLLIYSLQATFSRLYLKRWKMGPVEKLSRIWTYFSLTGRPKMKQVMEETA